MDIIKQEILIPKDKSVSDFSEKKNAINKKIQYEKRIKNLTKDQMYPNILNNSLKKVQSLDRITSISSVVSNRREQNKFSAKMSRQKKKIYYDLLQETRKRLQIQINELKTQIKNFSEKQDQSSEVKINIQYNKFMLEEQNFLNILDANHNDSNNLQILIDSYKYRFGTSGKQRKQLLQQLNQEIIQLMAPQHTLFFFYCAQNNQGIFSQDFLSVQEQYKINIEQFQILQEFKNKFKNYAEQFDRILIEYMNNQLQILNKSQQLEQLIDDQMTNEQFIYFIQKINKKSDSIDTIQKEFWDQDNELEVIQNFQKKKVKINNLNN